MTDTETSDWVLVPRDMPQDYLEFYEGVMMDEGRKGPGAAKKAWAALLKLVAATNPLSASPKGDDLEPVAFDATNRADQIAMGIATLDGEKWVRLCDYEAALQSIKAENATLKREIAAIAAFARWAIKESVFFGCNIDKAQELGLIVATKYDPEKHGPTDIAEPGDEWFVFSPALEAKP